MSAYIVSKPHIDLLVRYAVRGTGREPFRWWRVDEAGEFAGWRELDELYAESRTPSDHCDYVSPSQFGQILVSANVRSVSHRYSEPGRTPYYGAEAAAGMEELEEDDLPGPGDRYYLGPYVYEDPGYTLSPGELFKAIDNLDYQSCEHDDWRRSEAFALLAALRHEACTQVDGYAGAPWGFDADDLNDKPRDYSRRII